MTLMKSMKSMVAPMATLFLALGSTGCALEDFEDGHESTSAVEQASKANDKVRSVHVFTASAYGSGEESRIWASDGGWVESDLDNGLGGYFEDAYVATRDLDMSGVMAGCVDSTIELFLEDGGDPASQGKVESLRKGGNEVITMYREYKQEEGVWENKKTVTVWGYISSADLSAGPSSLAFEVHTVRVITQNDAVGTRDYAIDCITGASTIRGGTLGARTPEPIDPLGQRSPGWGALLNR